MNIWIHCLQKLKELIKNKQPSETRNLLNVFNVHCMTGYILEECGIKIAIPIFKQRGKKICHAYTLCIKHILKYGEKNSNYCRDITIQ